MTNLKPCPFCGGEASHYAIAPHEHSGFLKEMGFGDHPGSWWVECHACDVHIGRPTQEEVVVAWNMRAQEDKMTDKAFEKFAQEDGCWWTQEHSFAELAWRACSDHYEAVVKSLRAELDAANRECEIRAESGDRYLARAERLEAAIRDLTKLARRNHYSCEDSWYSCPKSEEGCLNEFEDTECNCGAEDHNKRVEAILSNLKDA